MHPSHIRNFCIIAHIDHGKSTLADRFLELTGTVEPRRMVEQVLDSMDLERERGITIKAQAVRMWYTALDGQRYELNLIDTPGHVDFSYEVSRALAACEGAILVVDASQGVQAQTVANVYLALEHDLVLIPVVNKIDLPNAEPAKTAQEMQAAFGFAPQDLIYASAKTGKGVRDTLEAVVARVPPPRGDPAGALRALVFDAKYDSYKGVIAYLRVVDGAVSAGERLRFLSTQKELEALEVGTFQPEMTPGDRLGAGEVGYLATGLKSVQDTQVGDTVTTAAAAAVSQLPGYRPLKPMVFAGLYPAESKDYGLLRDALDKLHLNDASLSYEPENSVALGPGFRAGFLGLLHMDIVQERLEREAGLNLIVTAPSVEYQVLTAGGEVLAIDNPELLPDPSKVAEVREPWMNITIIAPQEFVGAVMELVTERRGEFRRLEYLGAGASDDGRPQALRAMLEYQIPLSAILVDFYDQLKSGTRGYGSLDYSFAEFRPGKLVKLDILVNDQPVDALSLIVHQDEAQRRGRELVQRLRSLIPRQLFDVPIQAAVGSRIIARETIRALRKNVLAKCYGGDVTRKRKLLEKQAEGKRRLKRVGNVEIPQEAFMAVLKLPQG
ncbi:MAG: elongation factor 4 [Chloroflexi bacterium]|nr:elongation factor 4 [Chloroflexota bacterium]